MKIIILALFGLTPLLAAEKITPYKFTDIDRPFYEIPVSSKRRIKRLDSKAPDITYYLSTPFKKGYPIAILCGGSSSKDNVESIIHFHRYFLQEFVDLNIGVITIEQRGIDGHTVDLEEFIHYYTRSNRLSDTKTVIEELKAKPPNGWNGKLVFLGVSEGGPIVTNLTESYPEITLATINWAGAGDSPWEEELKTFLEKFISQNPNIVPSEFLDNYETTMNEIKKNPTSELDFVGMSYKYHADACNFALPNYKKILTPFLVVVGELDPILNSCDTFVSKAKTSGVNITYLRIPDMDHYIRKRPDIIEKSFDWLKQQIITDL